MVVDFDLRLRIGAARDQGDRPTCLSFAVSGAHEALLGSGHELSTEFLHYQTVRSSHGDPSQGVTSPAMEAALRLQGQPLESQWPYAMQAPDPATWWPPSSISHCYRASLAPFSIAVADIKCAVTGGNPVVLIVALSAALFSPSRHGVVDGGPTDRPIAARHALLAVGLGHADTEHYILVRNSWGSGWGQLGDAWLSDRYVVDHLREARVVGP